MSCAGDDQFEPNGKDRVDLVHAVCVFRKVCPRWIDISSDRIALRLQHPAQRLLILFAVCVGIPGMNAHPVTFPKSLAASRLARSSTGSIDTAPDVLGSSP